MLERAGRRKAHVFMVVDISFFSSWIKLAGARFHCQVEKLEVRLQQLGTPVYIVSSSVSFAVWVLNEHLNSKSMEIK